MALAAQMRMADCLGEGGCGSGGRAEARAKGRDSAVGMVRVLTPFGAAHSYTARAPRAGRSLATYLFAGTSTVEPSRTVPFSRLRDDTSNVLV